MVAVVWGFAVVQPLLDLIGGSPTFLIAHRMMTLDAVGLVVVALAGPPAVSHLFVFALRRMIARGGPIAFTGSIALSGLVGGSVGLGIGLLAMQAMRHTAADGWLIVSLSLAAACAGAWVFARFSRLRVVRNLVALLALGVLVFPVIFFATPGVRAALAPAELDEFPSVEVTGSAPVVLVVFDELPAVALLDEHAEIDATRFPAFAALARESLWYRNAFTVCDFTPWALPAILTGRLPDLTRPPSAAGHPESLYAILGGDYRVKAFETMTALCPENICQSSGDLSRGRALRLRGLLSDLGIVYLHLVVPTHWASALPPISGNWAGFGGETAAAGEAPAVTNEDDALEAWERLWKRGRVSDRLAHFEAFLASIDQRDRALYVLHLLLPHSPYWYLPTGARYDVSRRVVALDMDADRWTREPWSVAQAERRHLLQMGFVDQLLGRVVERLREVGVYDRALLVVTSDHGAAFLPGGRRRNLTSRNLGDVLPVPLFVKLPGEGATGPRERTALTIDIVPTIAEVVGAKVPWSLDGHSLLQRRRKVDSVTVRALARKHKEAQRVPLPQLLVARDAAVERRQARWQSGSWDSVLRYGPRSSLVGARVADLDVSPGGPAGILLKRPPPSGDVKDFVSSLVSGVAEGSAGREPRDLAIALRGTIVATTRTYRESSHSPDMLWQALLDERALRTGPNPLELFVVEGPDDAPRLLRVGGIGSP